MYRNCKTRIIHTIEKWWIMLIKSSSFCMCLICLSLCNSDDPLSFTFLFCMLNVTFLHLCMPQDLQYYVSVCICLSTHEFIHARWCRLQRTSGWHYIIWAPEGVLNVDTAWSSGPRQQECQHAGAEPLLEQKPAARKPQSRDNQPASCRCPAVCYNDTSGQRSVSPLVQTDINSKPEPATL